MPALPEQVQTLVIGGGQAGLAMSHMLGQRGCPHLVLERHRLFERWRSERWDGLHFQFPNATVGLPGFPFPHVDPGGFAANAEIVAFLDAYAARVQAPVRCGVAVQALRRSEDGRQFLAVTSAGDILARQVVVATGPYQRALVPEALARQIELPQWHASAYQRPEQLPPGVVLVVGSGASGAQIAEELMRTGRQVLLSVGRHRRLPRRYRGRDVIDWMDTMGLDRTRVEDRGPETSYPLISGAYGGHTVDLRAFAAQGMTLVGRLVSAQGGVLGFADDLRQQLDQGDAAYLGLLQRVDEHITQTGLDLPAEPEAYAVLPDPPCVHEPLREVDSRAAGLGAVIWATGYGLDFSWIDLPVFKPNGLPIHHHGVAELPGLYFLGLPWLSTMKSSFLSGVGEDAARLADQLCAAA
jgi:putative flavoprotein involved in K+ transport